MTTVACNKYGMASDSQQTGHYIDRIHLEKVFQIGAAKVGTAGNPASCKRFIEWRMERFVEETDDFPTDLGEDFCALEALSDRCYYWDDSGVPQDVGYPAAIGTGAGFAMGAMLAGATPAVAVRIAMELDPQTGGELFMIGEMKSYIEELNED